MAVEVVAQSDRKINSKSKWHALLGRRRVPRQDQVIKCCLRKPWTDSIRRLIFTVAVLVYFPEGCMGNIFAGSVQGYLDILGSV